MATQTLDNPSQARWVPPELTNAVRLQLHDLMVKARTTEEMLIRMMRTGHGYFWIGGPGEEAFGVPLGMLVHKGYGPAFDYLHLHYRSSPTVLAMGAQPIDLLRQMRGTATDPYSKGRNFVNHFAIKPWNVVPVTPTIETQYAVAPGTAMMQRRHGGVGLSIVTGGDAGSAEGDFYCGMNWSTRPGQELPVLFTIAHNDFGISTPSSQVQNTKFLNTRGDGFGIKNACVDGNDPIATWHALVEAMDYVRHERKPFILQANVSRLNGHSSSSGAARATEPDCLGLYEQSLLEQNLATRQELDAVWERWQSQLSDDLNTVLQEPMPGREHVLQHVFYDGPAGN
jgi:2-oxoisovalerate dehydrogenase E1 component alpha subunit